ncbi:unnamed protein product [Boreogadus saida]
MVAVFLLDSYDKANSSTPLKHGSMRPPPPPLSSIHTESVFDRADDFSVAGFQELDVSSPDETALEELDASMSSQDLTADVDADAYNDIQNATICGLGSFTTSQGNMCGPSVHVSMAPWSTAELESFHNHILMYASMRFSFSPPVYAARVMLAGLDYNHHLHRPARRKADGSIRYGKVYNKKSRKWSLYTLKQEKDYSYIKDLQSEILQKKLSGGGVPRRRTLRPTDPRQYGVLPGIPAPTTQELLQTQLSKGLGHSLPKV